MRPGSESVDGSNAQNGTCISEGFVAGRAMGDVTRILEAIENGEPHQLSPKMIAGRTYAGKRSKETRAMIKSEMSIVIDAAPEKVFPAIAKPEHVMEDIPNAVEVKDIQGEGKGTSYVIVYKMAGVRVTMECTWIEYVPDERLTIQIKGGIDAKQTWTLRPQKGRTKLDAAAEYTVPVPLVGRIAERLLKRQNEREWEVILANIKARVESEVGD